MLPYNAAEIELCQDANARHWLRVSLKDQSDAWQDMTSFHGVDWVRGIAWNEGADQFGHTATVVLHPGTYPLSIEPLVQVSPINKVAGAYDPLIKPWGETRIEHGVSVKYASAPIAWHNVFEGRIDEVRSSPGAIELPCRDLGGLLVDTRIKTEIDLIYSMGAGTPPDPPADIEDVMQDILDSVLGASVVTLNTPVSPGVTTRRLVQPPGQLFEELRKIALRIEGRDLRVKWNDVAGEWQLTFAEVDRTPGSTVATIGPNQYTAHPEHARGVAEIVNSVRVYYGGNGSYYEATDANSVSDYGERFMALQEGEGAQVIQTLAQATAVATALLADRSEPFALSQVEMPLQPWLEVHDYIALEANAEYGGPYDVQQEAAVVGVEHVYEAGTLRTRARLRGKPAAAFRGWQPIITPAAVFIADYQGENLLAQHPQFDGSATFDDDESATIRLDYLSRMIGVGSRISGSLMVTPSDAGDDWRAAIWFTDSAGDVIEVQTGVPYVVAGDLVTGTTSATLSRVHNVGIPAGTVAIHIGHRAEGTPTGTASSAKPLINIGITAGVYVEPPPVTQADVSLADFRELGEVDDPSRATSGPLLTWTPGSGVDEIHIFEGTAWPTLAQSPDTTLAGTATEHRVSWPSGGAQKFVEVRAVDANGATGQTRRAVVKADPDIPDPGTSISSAYLEVSLGASDIDLTLHVTAGAFPIDVSIKEGSTEGTATEIVTHTFNAAGSIDQGTYAAMGGRAKTPYPFGWWVTLTDDNGEVTKFLEPTPVLTSNQLTSGLVQGGHIVTGAISAFHIQAGSITATEIDSASVTADVITTGNLLAVDGQFTGDLQATGSLTTGKVGTVQNGITVNDPSVGSVNIGSFAGVNTSNSLFIGGYISMFERTTDNNTFITITADEVGIGTLVDVGSLRINGQDVTTGAADSGGSGFRLLRVPN